MPERKPVKGTAAQVKRIGKKRIYTLLLSAALSIGMVAAVWLKTGIYFETNDDRLTGEILAGIFGGIPSAQTVHINWLLSFPLMLLYRFTRRIPWYGLCLIFLQILSFGLIFDSVLGCAKRIKQEIILLAAVCAIFLLNLYSVGLLQFTSTAVIAALAGYVCLLLRKGRERFVLFAVLSLLSFLVRADSMLMVQPAGFAVYMGTAFIEKEKSFRSMAGECVMPVIIVFIILVTGRFGNLAGYHGREWNGYEKYNRARVQIFDYYERPSYEEIEEILKKYGVTKAEYEAYLNYIILDGDITPECAEEIAEYAKDHSASGTPGEIAEEFWAYRWQKNCWGVNRISIFACAAAIICIVIYRQYALLLPFGLFQAACLFVWTYLLYRGRMPLRVVMPLLACETVLLLALILKCVLRSGRHTKSGTVLLVCITVLFCWMSFASGRQQYRYIREQNSGQEAFMAGMRELEDYCRAHPENKYLMDAVSMSYYKGSALETEIYQPRNSMVTGCWYSGSPVMTAALKAYLKPDGRGIHLIVSEDGRKLEHPAVVYLQEKTRSDPELAEKFTASHGGSYLIWHFPGEITFTY